MRIFKNNGLVLIAMLLTACTPSTDTAPNDRPQENQTKSPIQARQDLMHRWGKANDKIRAMEKDKNQFNINDLHTNIAIIDSSQAQMWAYFGGTALTTDTKVNQLIKDNPADYQAHIKSFSTAFDELKTTAHRTTQFDSLKPLMDKVNQECKACHKTYKKRR